MGEKMLSAAVLQELRECVEARHIDAGITRLESLRPEFESIRPQEPHVGLAVSCLAQWIDLGFEADLLLAGLLSKIDLSWRRSLPVSEYIHVRLAEALAAMRTEELHLALAHLEAVLALAKETEEPKLVLSATLWKARCLRKAGEYAQALAVTREGMALAASLGLHPIRAVMQTLESWMLFQNGDSKEAIRILQDAEAVLRQTDDFITMGNIQSAYGRIALREGRYDHALQYFEGSIEYFSRRASLQGYLARSLTNMAQARRFLALQLRRSMDARWERQRRSSNAPPRIGNRDKAGQLERLHELLRKAQEDLTAAGEIYERSQNHHGAGNVAVNLAQIHLDLGNLERAEAKAAEAFELSATKADHLLMCRARIVQASVANARFEEEIGEGEDPSRFAQLAHDCAKEAIDLGEHTESRRLLAQAHICRGLTLVNGFFSDPESARACCNRAESLLNYDRHDALWQELDLLRERILHGGLEDPNLRAWSQGSVGDKSLQQVVGEFEELLIRKVWEHEGRKVSRVAHRLAVSPKKVRRVLRHLGVLVSEPE